MVARSLTTTTEADAPPRQLWLGFQNGRRKRPCTKHSSRLSTGGPSGCSGRCVAAQAHDVLETDRYPQRVPNKAKGSRPSSRPVEARIACGAELRVPQRLPDEKRRGAGVQSSRAAAGYCPRVARARSTWLQRPAVGFGPRWLELDNGLTCSPPRNQAARKRSISNGFLRSSM